MTTLSTEPLPSSALRRMPALDGLRAIAVLLVMCVHFGKLQAGWIGVQLFFVISGFLITGILLHERTVQPNIGPYLKRFFWRRSLRIFPAYYLYLAALFVLFILLGRFSEIDQEAPTLLSYLQNWRSALYRPGIGEGPELGHIWSLCVEEQFYLVWPFLIFLIPRGALGPILIMLVILAPALRWLEGNWMIQHWREDYIRAQSLYMMTPTHFDALAFGGVMAYYRLHERISRPMLWLLVGMVLFVAYGAFGYFSLPATGIEMRPSSLGYTYNTLQLNNHIWAYSVINFTMATMVLVAVGKANAVQRWLSTPMLMSVGVVSYGIYLWHQLILMGVDNVFIMVNFNTDGAVGTAARFLLFAGLTFAWAKLLFRFVERPILSLKEKGGRPEYVGRHKGLGL